MTSTRMKDSGIAWIGQVPEHWEQALIGSLYKLRNTKVSDKQFEPLSVTMRGILHQLENAAKTNDGDNRKLVKQGDFVINSRSDRRGACGISKYDGSVSLINLVLVPQNNMHPGYYDWLFHTTAFADEFYKWGHGIVDDLWTTRWQDMKNITIPLPSLPEQQRIADYLDKKCAEIDMLSNSIQQQIDTLEQYKRAVITETVTKGLNPSTPMKDSGIPWIGQIPQHWNMLKIKYIAKSNQKSLSEKTNPDYQINYIDIGSVSERKGIETYEEMQFSKAPSRARRIVKSGDCIVSTVRTYLKAIAFIDTQFDNYVVSTGFSVLTPMKQFLVNKYLFFLLKNHPLISAISAYSTGVNYPAISDSVLVNLKMPIPPKNEQQTIADYLDDKCSKIDAIIQGKQQQLEKLEQYKKATIFEYVTGKKQVPEV